MENATNKTVEKDRMTAVPVNLSSTFSSSNLSEPTTEIADSILGGSGTPSNHSNLTISLAEAFPNFETSPIVVPENFVNGVWEFREDEIQNNLEMRNSSAAFIFKINEQTVKFNVSDGISKLNEVEPSPESMTIKVGDSTYQSTISLTLERFLVSHFTVKDYLSVVVDEYDFSEITENIEQWRNAYLEFADYRDILVDAGGYGYDKIFDRELYEIFDKASLAVNRAAFGLYGDLIGSFFNYDISAIEDLSLVNGIRCYQWYTQNTLIQFEEEFLKNLVIEKFDMGFVEGL